MHFSQKLYFPILIICCLIILAFSAAFCQAENVFDVIRIGNILTYGDNHFHIKAPEAGNLMIKVHDDICVYRTMEWIVDAGESNISWDGCGYNKEKLYPKTYTISCVLQGESGAVYTKSFNTPVSFTAQSLQYALPSSQTLYISNPDEWFLEFRTVMDGTVIIELNPDNKDKDRISYAFSTDGGKINRKKYSLFNGKESPSTGQYTVHVYEASRPDEVISFPLTISEDIHEKAAVTVTGTIMPERGMSEKEIWDIMMRPSVVIDIDFFEHQDVFENPDLESRSLGTLHGQTQCLEVIKIENNWALVGAWNHEEAEYIEGWIPLQKLKVEEPQNEYGILIDKQKQTLSLFHHGIIVDTLFVSTGRPDENRLYQETSAGSFLTGYHRVNFSTNGKKYDYVFQYDGGNLLHQTPYRWGRNRKDFTLGRGYLGAKASHACIRIQSDPGESGINAYWLWTHIPYHTRVIILDDPLERRNFKQFLMSKKDKLQPLKNYLQLTDFKNYSVDCVTFTFGGNYIPGTKYINQLKGNSLLSFVKKGGKDKPFSGLKALFSQDDFTCVNLWSPLENTKDSFCNMPELNYCPASLSDLFEISSIEGVQISEQTIYDEKKEIIQSTEDTAGLRAVAICREKPVTVLIKGHLFGLASCSEQEYLKNPVIINQLINELKEKRCERIIMLISWGEEKGQYHSIIQEAMARKSVLAGADLIIGSHSHKLQGIDHMMDVPVIYSMGDLLDGSTWRKPKKQYGIIVRAVFSFDDNKLPPEITVIPIKPYGTELAHNNYSPTFDMNWEESSEMIDMIRKDSFNYSIEKTMFYRAR